MTQSLEARTRRILEQYGIHARKKFGQNFLISQSVVDGIIGAAGITKEDTVLEIGPGIGTMTRSLAEAAGNVAAVEIDGTLKPVLDEVEEEFGNVTILYQDILRTDLPGLCARFGGGRPLKVVANLPYYVTTPILMQLLENRGLFESITVMVQKEGAERICAEPGSREYGAITLAVAYYSDPEIALDVPPSSFIPRPNVDSSVLVLKAHGEPPVRTDEKLMFAVIRASFNQRRKTLVNGIVHGLVVDGKPAGISREQAQEVLGRCGFAPTVRGETLSLADFAAIAGALREIV